jgi:hypothetical protein
MVGRIRLQEEPHTGPVSIRRIKAWAATRLSADSTLRRVLEREQENIRPDDFVLKLGVWLQLLEIEENQP